MYKPCKYQTRCGGCVGIDKEISVELQEKTKYIKTLFKDIKSAYFSDCVGDYYPLKYRNKIHLAFKDFKGKTIIGFYEEGSTKVTDIEDCMLFGDWAKKLISILREYVSRFKIRPYSLDGSGVLRFAHARYVENKIQLTLVVVTENFAGREWLYRKLTQEFKEVSFYLNINRRTDHAVFDKNFKFIKGSKFLTFLLAGVKVSISPSSFLQVNLSIAEKMYKEALNMLDINSTTTVVDLYSGIGITSIMFARKCKKVISIEETPSSVENAKYMAKLNDVKNIMFLNGKCEKEIENIKYEDDTVVFVDPARIGLDNAVIDALLKLSPRKIVYMSCNPETCHRDIRLLLNDNDYKVNDIKCYNMFPYTKHIEALICLQK